MAARARSTRLTMARRRGWSMAFLASAVLHLVILGWFGLKRAVSDWRTEAPVVDVQLVRLPPPPPEAKVSPGSAAARASRPIPTLAVPPLAPASGAAHSTPASPGLTIDPRWRVDRSGPNPPTRREPDYDEFQPCDPLKDPRRESKACRKFDEIAESVTRFYDPQRGKTADAREARRNEALKRYRDAPGGSGYPGIGCAVLHRC